MSTDILCLDCSAAEGEKRKGVTKLGGGCYSFPLPAQSRCNLCGTEADGFKRCLACAIEHQCCQGCQTSMHDRYGETVKSQIAAARGTLHAAVLAATQTYMFAIAAFSQDADRYETACRESEQQFEADIKPWAEAEQLAYETYRALPRDASAGDFDRASKELTGARRQSSEEGRAAYERHLQRQKEAAAAFLNYAEYRAALYRRDGELRKGSALFTAEVKRMFGYFQVDRAYESALSLAELHVRPLLQLKANDEK